MLRVSLVSTLPVLLCAIKAINAGPCIAAPPVENFDFENYKGLWSEYAKTTEDVKNRACLQYFYSSKIEDDMFPVVRLWKDDRDDSPHMLLKNDKLNETGQGVSFDDYEFTVVATDYKNWAVIFGCDESANRHLVWILTRTSDPPVDSLHAISDILEKYHIENSELSDIDHNSCPHDWSNAERQEVDFQYEKVEKDLRKLGLVKG